MLKRSGGAWAQISTGLLLRYHGEAEEADITTDK